MTDLLTRIEQNQPVEAQELYDYIVKAIVKQGRPSVGDNDRCLYRGPDGLKCAAGHVIPDSMYSPVRMEDKSVDTLRRDGKLSESLIPHAALIYYLQRAHDGTSNMRGDFLDAFLSDAKQMAVKFNLKPYGQPT
jgi:hypothetical protein